ncbi:hypothetical protein [Oceanobacillus sp. J11TS1]|uniref:hypothetical protein n=1 Tax=Oceanobacillus sp. J11TS1 TaxID=2807191 RepID=UPI001B15815D|nr:hypothetical protein [Oceanobacillus sp. J11TS1]GIO23762.1 hypothetical protein J11TS1_23430 [Oceanobacillus sp. J11TS1]
MLRSFNSKRRQRAMKKVKDGDGHALKPYRFYEIFYRSLFYMNLREVDGELHTYAVHVNYFDENDSVDLYRDGKHHAKATTPAIFPVPGGVIEVAATTYGLKRIHYITEDEQEYVLSPDRRSAEGLRMRFDAKFPKASSIIGKLAIFTLLVSFILGLPQLASLISQFPFIEERWGSFESPIVLPSWLNMTLLIAGTVAAIERTLTLKNHWLIDMETSWWDE